MKTTLLHLQDMRVDLWTEEQQILVKLVPEGKALRLTSYAARRLAFELKSFAEHVEEDRTVADRETLRRHATRKEPV